MKSTGRHRVVWVTVPDLEVGQRIARRVLEARVAACVNIVPGVESHYWWQGRLESSKDLLLMIKTTGSHLEELERLVRAGHPYDTPEFVVLGLEGGSERYLDWIDASVGSGTERSGGEKTE